MLQTQLNRSARYQKGEFDQKLLFRFGLRGVLCILEQKIYDRFIFLRFSQLIQGAKAVTVCTQGIDHLSENCGIGA